MSFWGQHAAPHKNPRWLSSGQQVIREGKTSSHGFDQNLIKPEEQSREQSSRTGNVFKLMNWRECLYYYRRRWKGRGLCWPAMHAHSLFTERKAKLWASLTASTCQTNRLSPHRCVSNSSFATILPALSSTDMNNCGENERVKSWGLLHANRRCRWGDSPMAARSFPSACTSAHLRYPFCVGLFGFNHNIKKKNPPPGLRWVLTERNTPSVPQWQTPAVPRWAADKCYRLDLNKSGWSCKCFPEDGAGGEDMGSMKSKWFVCLGAGI